MKVALSAKADDFFVIQVSENRWSCKSNRRKVPSGVVAVLRHLSFRKPMVTSCFATSTRNSTEFSRQKEPILQVIILVCFCLFLS